MHPFPQKADLAFLLRGEPILQSLAIWPYGLTIGFDNGCSINVENAVSYVSSTGETRRYEAEWRNEQPVLFHGLLEQKLADVERSDLELALVFENGGRLIVHSDLSMYEAGQIYGPSGSMYVF